MGATERMLQQMADEYVQQKLQEYQNLGASISLGPTLRREVSLEEYFQRFLKEVPRQDRNRCFLELAEYERLKSTSRELRAAVLGAITRHMDELAKGAYLTGDRQAAECLREWVLDSSIPQDRLRARALCLLSQTGFFVMFEQVLKDLCNSTKGREIIAGFFTAEPGGQWPYLVDPPLYAFRFSAENAGKWNTLEKRAWLQEEEKHKIAQEIIEESLKDVKDNEKGGWEGIPDKD